MMSIKSDIHYMINILTINSKNLLHVLVEVDNLIWTVQKQPKKDKREYAKGNSKKATWDQGCCTLQLQ